MFVLPPVGGFTLRTNEPGPDDNGLMKNLPAPWFYPDPSGDVGRTPSETGPCNLPSFIDLWGNFAGDVISGHLARSQDESDERR
jgi:hypothetical protein